MNGHFTAYIKQAAAVFILMNCLFPGNVRAQESFCRKAKVLWTMLDKYHYQPQPQDAAVSSEIFDHFIDALDPERLFFTQADLDKLAVYRTQQADQVRSNSCTFFQAVCQVYKNKLVYADTLISFYLDKPVDLGKPAIFDTHTIEQERERGFPKTDADLAAKWGSYLKFQLLRMLVRPTPALPEPLMADTKTLLAQEPAVRTKVKTVFKRHVRRILKAPEGFETLVGDTWLKTLAMRYDPHSIYLSPSEKEAFLSMISTEYLSFGFYYDENKNNEIEVTHIVPGGSAWRSNQVNIGDVLLKVRFAGQPESDLEYADIEEVNDLFSVNNLVATAEFTLRKTNGHLYTLTLQQEKLEQDVQVVKSYLLQGDKKIGYISLPSFYDDWQEQYPMGCGNDVAKEIQQLQNEQIEGLIFDLRYNSGGSLREALNLAGIFLDEGPLCVIRNRVDKPIVVKDINRGSAYSGPLVVLVNSQSASASELLAAVLQDYRRAVIVGSTTFGKATAQQTYPLDLAYDPKLPSMHATSPLGYANITGEKFYRVTSRSHQNTGVKPDVYLPEHYYLTLYKESMYDHALAADTVPKTVYYTPGPPLPLAGLSQQSAQRVGADPNFSRLVSLNDSLRMMDEFHLIPLKLEAYLDMKKRFRGITEAVDTLLQKPALAYTVGNVQTDQEFFRVNSFSKQLNDELLKKIQHDIYLDEAYRVMLDLLKTMK